jgi:hypothetical protein
VERHEGIEGDVERPGQIDQLAGLGVLLPFFDLGEVRDREARTRRDGLQRLALLLAQGLQLQAQDVAKLVVVERRRRVGRSRRFPDRKIVPFQIRRIFAYKAFSLWVAARALFFDKV